MAIRRAFKHNDHDGYGPERLTPLDNSRKVGNLFGNAGETRTAWNRFYTSLAVSWKVFIMCSIAVIGERALQELRTFTLTYSRPETLASASPTNFLFVFLGSTLHVGNLSLDQRIYFLDANNYSKYVK
uniref:Uncharacterized protein n=1 Tax=Lotharella globosa TaxID=91324 RepID=A0A6V3PC63_9EUKA|mmetsp:Transcript_15203/g.30783  ORF Transcript_15203/g.30783 Transcript_15203/m.30783 type:complete len:128 (+) Transcript_15203:733-1116(+)